MATPYSIEIRDEVGSTQDVARGLALSTGEPAVVIARRQSRGRGRTGRPWQTAPRAVAVSLAVPGLTVDTGLTLLPLAAGVQAADVLGAGVNLKWPNDVVTAEGKVGGMLAEVGVDVVVVGLGVNLWWPGHPDGFAAVNLTDPGPDEVVRVGEEWASGLLERLSRRGPVVDLDRYRSICSTIGRAVTWDPEGYGRAVGVDASGGLVVNSGGRTVILTSGEVRHVRLAD